jgi:hypothetical protein
MDDKPNLTEKLMSIKINKEETIEVNSNNNLNQNLNNENSFNYSINNKIKTPQHSSRSTERRVLASNKVDSQHNTRKVRKK